MGELKKTEEELTALAKKVTDVITDAGCNRGEGMKIFTRVIYPVLLQAPDQSYTLTNEDGCSITFSCTGVPDGDENDNS